MKSTRATRPAGAASRAPKLRIHTLPGGLRVVLRKNDALPLATADMWVRVGGGNEPRPLAGISHFLEHMMFKGTERLAVGEYDARIEGLGGYLNASTSGDATHYYVEVPSDNLDVALEDFADVMSHSMIDAQEMESERLVILEEIHRKNDDPNGFLYDNLVCSAIVEGAGSHPVIGFEESVRDLSRDSLAEHYRRYYTADNMFLVISGAFDEQAILGQLERVFDDLPPTRRPWNDREITTLYALPQERTWNRDWKETYFYLSFPVERSGSVRESVLRDCAEALLASGRTSRLVNALREKKRLVSSIGAWVPTGVFPGVSLIGGRCELKNLHAARDVAFEEIQRLVEDGLLDGEERRLRRRLNNSFVYLCETNSDVASLIGYSYVALGSEELFAKYVDTLKEIEMDEVLQFIKSTFTRDRSSLFVTTGEAAS